MRPACDARTLTMSEPLADEPMSWPVASSADLHRDDWVVALRSDQVQRPGHPDVSFRRLVMEDPGAVLVLAIDERERVVVLRQYRHPVRMRLVELPAGILDIAGEDPMDAAKRELREEAAVEAQHWQHLLTTFASPGISEETHAIFLARGLRDVDRGYELEHEEAEMTVERVPIADLIEAVLDHQVQDAPLATAVLAYEALQRRGRLPEV